MKKLWLILVMVLFPSVSDAATTYYVSYVHGETSNAGTTGDPWKYIPGDSACSSGTNCTTTPAAGDTICVEAGEVYNSGNSITLKSDGTSVARIVYDGNCSGWGDGTRAKVTNDTNFIVTGRDYNTIKNFEVYEFTEDVVVSLSTSSNWCIGFRFENNYVHDGWIPDYGVLNLWGTQNAVVTGNTFEYCNGHRNGYGNHTGGNSSTTLTDSTKSWTVAERAEFVGRSVFNHNYGDCGCVITSATENTLVCASLSCGWHNGDEYGIADGGRSATYFRGAYPGSDPDSTNMTFSSNTIDSWGDSPIFFYGTHGTISGNTIKGHVGNTHSQGITYYYMNDAGTGYIYNNYFTSERGFMTVEGMTNETIYTYNNLVNNNGKASPINAWSGSTGTWYIVNNVFIGGSGGEVGTTTSPNLDVYFVNNITENNFGDDPVMNDYNCCTNEIEYCGAHGVYTSNSAVFVNSALSEASHFAQKAGSPCIDKGINASSYGVTTDYLGYSRPAGSAFDMGAYEYGAGTTPPSATGCTIQGGPGVTFK